MKNTDCYKQRACPGNQRKKKEKKTTTKPWLSSISLCDWIGTMTISASRYTHCNYYPHPDRNPISDSSGAFRVEHNLTMCHHSSQAKLPEDALDFTQTTTISMQRKHRPGRGLPSHYQIKQFQKSPESRWYPSIAPLCGFHTTLNHSQTNNRTSKPWKKTQKPSSKHFCIVECPPPHPLSSQTLFVFKSSVTAAKAHTQLMRHVCSPNVP